ncbi:hypothetical protein CHS0354_034118 [Potamilus streckersoni]|uniref:VWFA domain-containing protein n=1 Tax=Potamilus streckersoni TaxID=2493646 RepID=A0AAE0WBJ6_9BIVA|nr:hypothetical protein CHS0354_034118 [Potamilus streckersoni]
MSLLKTHFMLILACCYYSSEITGDMPCIKKQADIVFVLDSSASIWEDDFNEQLKFVQKLIENFHVGKPYVQIGVVTFNTNVYPQFHLKDYQNKESMKTAISNIRYNIGGTETDKAIQYARDTMFLDVNGGRLGVAKIIIVITDGYSSKPHSTAMEASIAQSHGITMFSIGVGSGVKRVELKAMASKPTDKYVFEVNDYSALDFIRESLTETACDGVQSDQPHQPQPDLQWVKRDCSGKPADVYFVLDSSSSIWMPNFKKQLNFVKDIVNQFDIGPNKTRVAVVTFSDGIHPVITLDGFHEKKGLLEKIDTIPYLTGGTKTGSTLEYIRTRGFSPQIARQDVVHIAIVMTDGQSVNIKKTEEEANSLQKQGVYLFAIGIGHNVDTTELAMIASNPDEAFLFQVDDYNALTSIKDIIAVKTCTVETVTNVSRDSPVPYHCKNDKSSDIMFVLDSNGIGTRRTFQTLSVIHDLVVQLNRSKTDRQTYTNIGILMENCHSRMDTPLSRLEDPSDFLNKMDAQLGESLGSLIRKMRIHSFTPGNGGRPNAKKIAVIFMDADIHNSISLQLELNRTASANIEMIIVTVGKVHSNSPIESTMRDLKGYLNFVDYAELLSDYTRLLEIIC